MAQPHMGLFPISNEVCKSKIETLSMQTILIINLIFKKFILFIESSFHMQNFKLSYRLFY